MSLLQIQRLENTIEELRQKNKEQENIIKELSSIIIKPSFSVGDKVNIFLDSDTTYIIQSFMYEESYPVYNIIPIDSTEEDAIETVLEADLIKI